jgi:hypothetical protein
MWFTHSYVHLSVQVSGVQYETFNTCDAEITTYGGDLVQFGFDFERGCPWALAEISLLQYLASDVYLNCTKVTN